MSWTKDVPTVPGLYWFFGVYSDSREEVKPEMMLVHLRMAGPAHARWPMYTTNGAFVYPHKGDMKGKWTPADPPDPPDHWED